MHPRARFAPVICLVAAALPRLLSAAESRGLELTVLVDGLPAPEYTAGGRVYVEALRGREFALRVRNPFDERVAVAVSVDGRNVVDAKRTTAGRATKWVLAPGQVLEIPGWQISGETARRFFFTETSRSYAKWLGDVRNVGLIEAVFYRERRRPQPVWEPRANEKHRRERMDPAPAVPPDAGTDASEGLAQKDTAGGSASPPESGATKGRDGFRGQAITPRVEEDFAATGIGERTSFPVRWTSFDEDPVPVGRIAIRYEFRRELVRLGVLPRQDDLATRERARGFEPDYAPDPHRQR